MGLRPMVSVPPKRGEHGRPDMAGPAADIHGYVGEQPNRARGGFTTVRPKFLDTGCRIVITPTSVWVLLHRTHTGSASMCLTSSGLA